jgi:membrane protein DedA with SNARE-associated domain
MCTIRNRFTGVDRAARSMVDLKSNQKKETLFIKPAGIEQISSGLALLVIVFIAQVLKEMGIPSFGLTHSILLYAGYQFSSGSIYLGVAVILFIFLGSLCGASLIFQLGRLKGKKLLSKLEHHNLIKPEARLRAGNILTRSSFITISIGRSIPGLMLPSSILAGIRDMPVSSFLLGVIVPLSLWVSLIVTMGSTFNYFLPHIYIPPSRLLTFLWPFIAIILPAAAVYMWKRIADSQNGKDGIQKN